MKNKKKLIDPVRSITDLHNKAMSDDKYRQLAVISARNLGKPTDNLSAAIQWLRMNASETDEGGVVDEINFCRDLVK